MDIVSSVQGLLIFLMVSWNQGYSSQRLTLRVVLHVLIKYDNLFKCNCILSRYRIFFRASRSVCNQRIVSNHLFVSSYSLHSNYLFCYAGTNRPTDSEHSTLLQCLNFMIIRQFILGLLHVSFLRNVCITPHLSCI